MLIGGTLKLDFLTTRLITLDFTLPAAPTAQAVLDRLVPVNTIKGDEGLSLQGVILITLLALIGATALRGLGKVDEGFNKAKHNGVSTGERIIRTVERPAHVAKNRLGLPEEIPLDYRVFAALVRGEDPSAAVATPAPTTDTSAA